MKSTEAAERGGVMSKPAILSLGAVTSMVIALAIPTYNGVLKSAMLTEPGEQTGTGHGKYWHCVTQTGPDAPNLIVLQENGHFLKLIDHTRDTGNDTDYDLQGRYDIEGDRLVMRIGGQAGGEYTDTYIVKQLDTGKMLMTPAGTASGQAAQEKSRYSCRMLASRS